MAGPRRRSGTRQPPPEAASTTASHPSVASYTNELQGLVGRLIERAGAQRQAQDDADARRARAAQALYAVAPPTLEGVAQAVHDAAAPRLVVAYAPLDIDALDVPDARIDTYVLAVLGPQHTGDPAESPPEVLTSQGGWLLSYTATADGTIVAQQVGVTTAGIRPSASVGAWPAESFTAEACGAAAVRFLQFVLEQAP